MTYCKANCIALSGGEGLCHSIGMESCQGANYCAKAVICRECKAALMGAALPVGAKEALTDVLEDRQVLQKAAVLDAQWAVHKKEKLNSISTNVEVVIDEYPDEDAAVSDPYGSPHLEEEPAAKIIKVILPNFTHFFFRGGWAPAPSDLSNKSPRYIRSGTRSGTRSKIRFGNRSGIRYDTRSGIKSDTRLGPIWY